MKYIVILGDGMADLPVKELGNKTPLDCAKHPNMDFIAANGICGLAKTVPQGMPPGSDTANLLYTKDSDQACPLHCPPSPEH